MIDFSTLQGMQIPEGVVTQIAKDGVVLWSAENYPEGAIVLKVEKVTSDTYASETLYENEQFILYDIYPKTNGTVTVTYEGLTKTITDTSGVKEPNAQQVYFGTFNGVSDAVETPASGTLIIEGEYRGVGHPRCTVDADKVLNYSTICCTAHIVDLGVSVIIPKEAFTHPDLYSVGTYIDNTKVVIPESVATIGGDSFSNTPLASITIPAGVTSIDYNPFAPGRLYPLRTGDITVDENNAYYHIAGKCLVETKTNRLILGFSDSIIPDGIITIGDFAFEGREMASITIPASVTSIGKYAFSRNSSLKTIILKCTTPPTFSNSCIPDPAEGMVITVPAGCGDAYKAAEDWADYADYITEAS